MTMDWEGGTLEESGKLDEPDYRCKHGAFVGDPYGPDYMCGWCEMGISDKEYDKMMKEDAKHCRMNVKAEKRVKNFINNYKKRWWVPQFVEDYYTNIILDDFLYWGTIRGRHYRTLPYKMRRVYDNKKWALTNYINKHTGKDYY